MSRVHREHDPLQDGSASPTTSAGVEGKASMVLAEFTAGQVVGKVVKLLAKPGTSRKRLFQSQIGRRVYAYSIDPEDARNLVREDKDGNRVKVRLEGERFRVVREKKGR